MFIRMIRTSISVKKCNHLTNVNYLTSLKYFQNFYNFSRTFPKVTKRITKTKLALRMYSWKKKLESEEFSQNLGFNNPEVLKYRRFQKTLGGPGSYNQSSDFDYKIKASTFKNVGFGVEKRFKSFNKDANPPPGTYTKFLKISKFSYQFSKLPTFERDGFIDRFRARVPNYLLPPNLYKPTPITRDKIISKRGPYDCFTGPRDDTTIKNYFAPPAFKPPDKFYTVPSHLDQLLRHSSKRRTGKFLKSKRFSNNFSIKVYKQYSFCMKNPKYPGPGRYNIVPPLKFEIFDSQDQDDADKIAKDKLKSRYVFFTSTFNARPRTQWKIHPGPGRYSPKSIKCCKANNNNLSWMFSSGTKRNIYPITEYNAF